MNFRLSTEQRDMAETVRAFALERGDAGARRAAFESESGHDAGFWQGLMELGAGGVLVPERYGGLGLKMIDLALIAEALGYAAAPGPFLGHVLAALAIDTCGSAAQKDRWLPKLASGEAIGTIAFCEADERFAPEHSRLKYADGGLVGQKRDVLCAELADVLVVSTAAGLALVEKGAAGVSFERRDGADRTRQLSHITFADTPAEPLPGKTIAPLGDAALVLLAADAFGGASRCLDMAVAYAKTREQFGRAIGAFQGVKHQLANMAVDVEPARGLFWYAAYVYDAAPDELPRMAAAAKAHLGDVFMQAARLTIEIHGGIGYTWEHDAQIYFKRAMFDFAYFGAPSRHRDRQAALAGWTTALPAQRDAA